MRILGGVCAAVLAVMVSSSALAEENLPQNIQKCYDNAMATVDINDCIGLEEKYWDKLLNINYQKALKACVAQAKGNLDADEQEGFVAKCRKDLKTAQIAWLKYRDAFSSVQCSLYPDYGGTAQSMSCASMYKELVKEQALKLGALSEGIL